jgi:hypothetical protein
MAATPDSIKVNVVPTGADGETLTEAEAIGVLVTGTINRAERERDAARTWAVALEQELAEAERHLAVVLADLAPSSWASTTAAREDAQAFLDRDRVAEPGTVGQSPEPTPGA